ncbi:MAG: hypothetical protein DI570_24555 [Phenylobacterium zucineum]|nr:MAG: hypothetical protein DI570_24555 [Phenylobacterium zucineum]
MLKTTMIAAAALLATAAQAQPATPLEAMAPLKPLLGQWKGEGWIARPGVGRETFIGEETITERLGGAAVLVEGKHRSKADPSKVVHDAMAVIIWSPRDKAYRFRSQLATGQYGDAPMTVEPGRFVWTLQTPDGGRVEYATTFDATTWRETGRYTKDGVAWTPTFEMTLKKID